MLFQHDNACPHTAAGMQCAFCGVQQLLCPARSPDLSLVEIVWDMMKWELTLSPEPATTIAELQQQVQDVWDNLSQDDIRHIYDHLCTRIHACVAARGVHCVLMYGNCLGTPYHDFFSFVLNLSRTSTVINYLSHQFSIQ